MDASGVSELAARRGGLYSRQRAQTMRPVPSPPASMEKPMTDAIAGIISLATALGFLGVLLYKVVSVPLWAVVLLGAAMMVASLLESLRGNGNA